MTDELADIIEEAYRLFKVPRPVSHQCCTACCISPEHDREFHEVAARDLSNGFIRDWESAAFSAPAAPGLARHMLPRLMQALVQDADLLYPENIFQRLRTGDGEFWTKPERALIGRFQRIYLDQLRSTDFQHHALDDVLCLFANAGHDLDDLLAQVWAWSDADLAARLHYDWHFGKRIWQSTFWQTEHRARAYAWYTSTEMQDRLLNYMADDGTDYETCEQVDLVLTWIAAG